MSTCPSICWGLHDTPSSSTSSPLFSPWVTSILHFLSMMWPFSVSYLNETIWWWPFHGQLLSFNTMFSRVIYKSNMTSLFFKANYYSTMCIDHTVCIHFPVQGHLDGFYIMDTVNNAAVNTGDKYSPNSSKFSEQQQKMTPVNLLSNYSQVHYPSP